MMSIIEHTFLKIYKSLTRPERLLDSSLKLRALILLSTECSKTNQNTLNIQ